MRSKNRFSMDECRNLFRFFSTVIALLGTVSTLVFGAETDRPFPQAISRKYALPAELAGKAKEICIDRDGIVYLRSEAGVARLSEDRVHLDRSYRPLAGKVAT